MPNYSFIVDATYDPRSYEEIAAPIRGAAAYHQALQDKYDELKLTTQMYDALIPKDDPEYALARQYYDTYLAKLNEGADALMNGAWGQRDTLSGVRDSFGRYMMPVQKAWEKRDLEQKEQRELRAKNPLLEFSRDAYKSGLDTYINNLSGGYERVDPVVLTGMVSTAASMFAKELRDHPDGPLALEIKKTDPEGFLAITSGQGLRPEQVLNWMKVPALYSIMKRTLNSVGMDMDENGLGVDNGVWTADATNRVINKMYTGLASGVGGETLQLKEDPEYAARLAMMSKMAQAGGPDMSAYFLPNDSHWNLDDSLTDGSELDRLQNTGAWLGLLYDKDTNTFSVDDGTSISSALGRRLDSLQAKVSETIPFRRSTTEILEDVAKDNGWTFKEMPGMIYKDIFNTPGALTKKDGKPVTREELAKALSAQAQKSVGSYHSLQDISLTDYNAGFKGLKAYKFSKLMKDGSYKKDADHPVSLNGVLSDKDASISVGLDMTPKSEGLTIRVSKGDKFEYYNVSADSINNSGIKSAVKKAVEAARVLNAMKKQMGLSDEEWSNMFKNNMATYEMGVLQMNYVEAVKALQNAIGSGNSVSNVNVNNT